MVRAEGVWGLRRARGIRASAPSPGPYLIRPPVRVHSFRIGLVLDAVQVLVQPIQQESHELLGVMLCVARELAGLAGHNGLEAGPRREHRALGTWAQLAALPVLARPAEVTFNLEGWKAWWVPFHSARSSTAKPMARRPPVPSGLL